MDGEPNGRMTCELSNWTGKAFKLPRRMVKSSTDRPELEGTGIYILFGKTDSVNNQGKAYIGEAENIYNRIVQQLSAKEFWTEVIVFVSKDENLNKAHIKYLEARLYEVANRVKRYEIDNTSAPTKSSISESDQAEMEEFLNNVKLLVNTLGYNIFEEIRRQTNSEVEQETTSFFIKAARGADAEGQRTNEGFAVLKGSFVAIGVTNSFPTNLNDLRLNLLDTGVIIRSKNGLMFAKDYLFSSPSTAAGIVMGRSANGLTEWKTRDGRILKSME